MELRCTNCKIQFTPKSQSYSLYIKHQYFIGETIWCQKCNKTYKFDSAKKDRKIKLIRAEMIAQIKLSRGCEWEGGCEWTEGKNVDSLMLDLDHLDPEQKTEDVAKMVNSLKYSNETLLEEVAKCRVLCKMHHAIAPTSTRNRSHLIDENDDKTDILDIPPKDLKMSEHYAKIIYTNKQTKEKNDIHRTSTTKLNKRSRS